VAHDTWTVGRALRWFTLGSGQLKRGSDRLQVMARVLLFCALTMSVPIALAAGSAAHAQARSQAAAESATRHRQDARLLEDAVVASDGTENSIAIAEADAVWAGPSGEQLQGLVPVAAGTKAGSLVPVWLDRDGHRTGQPLSDADVRFRFVGWAVLTLVGVCVFAVASYTGFRVGLDRSRSRRWAAEWAAVEPRWNRQVS
jgi:hypothetical protein